MRIALRPRRIVRRRVLDAVDGALAVIPDRSREPTLRSCLDNLDWLAEPWRLAYTGNLSLPRDLWVNIPSVGMQRINTAYEYGENGGYAGGGPGLLKDTILYNFGLQIDHTVMVDFNGFRQIVSTIGGIDVPISCPYTDWRLIDPSYNLEDENNWALYTAGPGLIGGGRFLSGAGSSGSSR